MFFDFKIIITGLAGTSLFPSVYPHATISPCFGYNFSSLLPTTSTTQSNLKNTSLLSICSTKQI
jgi:hypothetical protein